MMPTEKLLKQMEKQGYIVKERDLVTEDVRFDFYLGPRGKVEVGKEGTMELVRKVCPLNASFVNYRFLAGIGRRNWANGLYGVCLMCRRKDHRALKLDGKASRRKKRTREEWLRRNLLHV